MMLRPSRRSSPVSWEPVSSTRSRTSESASPSAASRPRISACTILTPRSSSATSMARRRRFPSVLLTSGQALTSTLPFAASASTATASATRFCSTQTSAAMWVRIIPATGWTDSSRPSYLPRFSPRLQKSPTWASAILRSPDIRWSWRTR